MSSTIKKRLVAVLKSGKFYGEQLDAADKTYLRRWADNCADDPIWEEIVADGRANGSCPEGHLHSELIWYALQARRLAESMKSGDDPIFRERQKKRAELLELAGKADDLARYYQWAEKYSGIAAYYQRFIDLPVTPEQAAVPRIESSSLRVQQLRILHEREAEVLRRRASREPQHTTFISRKKSKRRIAAFIHLMTDYMEDFCGKQHRGAVAMLATMASNSDVDKEDVRKTLKTNTREGQRRKIRAFNAKES